MLWGISEMVNARAFKPLPLCSVKVGSSAKFCVVVCKASLLCHWGVHWPKKVHLPSLCSGMQVISALVLGGHWPKKVHLPSLVEQYSWHLCSIPRGSICQSMFICQVLHTGIQGKYHLSELKSLIVIWGCFGGCWGGLHLTCLYNANWLFTTLIIQK